MNIYTIILSAYTITLPALILPSSLKKLWATVHTEVTSKEIPVSASSHISIDNLIGSISVYGWDRDAIVIEVIKNGTAEEIKNTKVTIKYEKSSATAYITTHAETNQPIAKINLIINAPEKSMLDKVSTNNGDITIRDIFDKVTVSTLEGNVLIKNIRGALQAHTSKGTIEIRQKTLDKKNFMLLDALQGNVTLYLPLSTHADVQAKTTEGVVKCDHFITLEPQTIKLNNDSWNQFKKEAVGVIGDNEKRPKITIDVTKGNISLLVTSNNE